MMASRKEAGDYAEDLICPICLELFKDAVILECGHNFCRSCTDSVWGSQKALSCPECRQVFPAKKYIVNRALTNVAERARTQNLGEKRQRPNLVQSNQMGSDSACRDERLNLNYREHNERLKLFYKEDETPICGNHFESPKRFSQGFMQDAVSLYKDLGKTSSSLETKLKELKALQTKQEQKIAEIKDKLIKASSSLECKLKELKALQTKQEQKIMKIKENGISLVEHIALEFDALHQFLHEKEQQFIQQLKEEEAGMVKEMEENLRKIKVQICTVQGTISDIRSRLDEQNSQYFVKECMSLIANLCGNQLEETGCESRLITGEIHPGVFRGPLQYMVWKEMKSVVRPGLSPLTLDLKTAHPYLILSKDRTSVRSSETKQRSSNSQKIFTHNTCLLGSTGFTSGRHYWEVEVGAKIEWNMGVARESISRNELITRTPEQGYWVLWHSNTNEYKALESEPKALDLSVRPQKIGVYLDYGRGQVSFYNAKDMSHIYTFTDNFTEKLYPFFSPGPSHNGANVEPLKICH